MTITYENGRVSISQGQGMTVLQCNVQYYYVTTTHCDLWREKKGAERVGCREKAGGRRRERFAICIYYSLRVVFKLRERQKKNKEA